MARALRYSGEARFKQLTYDDRESEDGGDSKPQLGWEQEGELTGDRINTFPVPGSRQTSLNLSKSGQGEGQTNACMMEDSKASTLLQLVGSFLLLLLHWEWQAVLQ